jgi:hypothetical protein
MRCHQVNVLMPLSAKSRNAFDSRPLPGRHANGVGSRTHARIMVSRCTLPPVGVVNVLKTPDPAFARRAQIRPALTLIEVMVVVVLSSLVMGVVISFAVALQRSDRNVRAYAVRGERLSELGAALRSDLRQATEVSLPEPKTLALKLAGGREIDYELADGGCRRVSGAEQLWPDREFFAIGAAESWTLERAVTGRRPLIILTMSVAKHDKDRESQPAPMLVYAALGADLPGAVAPIQQSNGNESQQKTEEEEVEQEGAEEAEEDEIN